MDEGLLRHGFLAIAGRSKSKVAFWCLPGSAEWRRSGAKPGNSTVVLRCRHQLQCKHYVFNPIHRCEYAAAPGERAEVETHGQPSRLDCQRRQRAPGGGGPAPLRVCLHRFPRFCRRPPGLCASSSLAVWEVALLLRAYKQNASAVARHLGWPGQECARRSITRRHFTRKLQQLWPTTTPWT